MKKQGKNQKAVVAGETAPNFRVIKAAYTPEDRAAAIQEIKDAGLTLCYAHEITDPNTGDKFWEVCGKNINAAVRPGLQFAD